MSAPTRQLRSYLDGYRRRTVLGFLFVVGTILFGLATPFILRIVIDGLEAGSLSRAALLRWVGLFFAGSLIATLCSVFMRKLILGVAQCVEDDLRRDVFNHLTTLDHAFYQRERTGDLMTKMSSDLGSIRDLVGQGLLQGSRIVIGFPLAFGIMFTIHATLALAILAIMPVVSIAFYLIIRMIRARYDASQEQFSAISTFCQEAFAGFRTVKGFGIEARMRGRFKTENDEYIRRNMALTRAEEPVWPFMVFMFGMGTLILLMVGGRLVIRGDLTIGQFVQFNQYMLYLHWPMLALGWTSNLIQRGLASWKRVRTILDARPDIPVGPPGPADHERIAGDIAFENVGLRLGGQDLLSGINLAIPRGQTLAITGPTGSGKSLLVSLIYRLLDPTAGRITIGGRDLRDLPVRALRRSFGVAPQEPFLFSDTLANNIAFGLPPASDPAEGAPTHEDKVVWASSIAHLHDDIQGFPDKFRTLLGERGVTLSGGQRQRTAISRAIALDPEILVLDDIFSAVDTQTEAAILGQLLPVLDRKTSILISHRVSTLKHADRILVIEGGRIVQDGTHADLAARDGYYRDLDELQRLEARLEEDEP